MANSLGVPSVLSYPRTYIPMLAIMFELFSMLFTTNVFPFEFSHFSIEITKYSSDNTKRKTLLTHKYTHPHTHTHIHMHTQ